MWRPTKCLGRTPIAPIPPVTFLPTFKGGEAFFAIQNLFDTQYDTDKGGGILKIGTPFFIQGGARLEF